MPDQLLNLLKLFLLLLLYLFFLRVLRAVWAEINPPKLVEAPPKPKRGPRRATVKGKHAPPVLRLIAPAELKGRTYPLGEEITLGRAAGCQVTIDDTYASQLHARVFQREGQVYVEDLGSTNGTYLGSTKVSRPTPVPLGSVIRIGKTEIELRA